jgi:GNAT superfamily N-acetyltransferase
MDVTYFNFQTEYAASRSQRRAFLQRWWSLGCDDPAWTPPCYAEYFQHLVQCRDAHTQRLRWVFLSQEAVRRRRGRNSWEMHTWVDSGGIGSASLGIFTSAAGIVLDERLDPGTAYLFLPHVINDAGCSESLFDALASTCADLEICRLLGPTSLSPYIESGVQLDYWHLPVPNLVASNPPYLPELLAQFMQPVGKPLNLWHLPISARLAPSPQVPGLRFEPLARARLADDLLPLMVAACEAMPGFPPPDRLEVSYLLSRLPPTAQAWQAIYAGEMVGFTIIGPDISPALRAWRGGRNLVARLILSLALERPFQHGRIYFASVLPAFRRQGLGRHLLHQAIQLALAAGWRSLISAPLAEGSPGAALLASAGAQRGAAYRFFELEW